MLKSKIILLVFLKTCLCFSQQSTDGFYVFSFFKNVQQLNIDKAYNDANSIKDDLLKEKVLTYYHLISKDKSIIPKLKNDVKSIVLNSESNLINCLNHLILAEYEFSYQLNRGKAFELLTTGLQKAEKLDNNFLQIEFLLKIYSVYRYGVVSSDKNFYTYLDKLNQLATDKYSKFLYYENAIYVLGMGLIKSTNPKKRKNAETKIHETFLKLDSVANTLEKNALLKIKHYQIKGLDLIRIQNYNEAVSFFNKVIERLKNKKNTFYNPYKYNALKEIARAYNAQKQHKKALINLQKSRKYESTDSIRNNFIYNLYVSDIYNDLKKYDSAFITIKKAFHQSFTLNFKEQNNLISSLEVKNKTKQKEIENLRLKQQNREVEIDRKQHFALLVGSLLLLIFVTAISVLSLKVINKKRLLAEQQKAMEIQKNLTLLKEQEINTINAMVEGQEKERKRIAEDLHDNIGSVLATLKLHFENLKLNRDKKHFNQDELYEKTEKLIDETYLKVRSIAHEKNAGIIANQGLLSAIKVMVEKISSANQLHIEIIDFGLNKRLENSLEITIFRIIQELITNVLKHAEAKNITINLSAYKKNLNLIVEDDGKGFDTQKIDLENGMGLSSIKTRVEHLNGTFEIDATLKHGTTVIIDIPLS